MSESSNDPQPSPSSSRLRLFLAIAFVGALFLCLILSFIAIKYSAAYGLALISASGLFGQYGLATLHRGHGSTKKPRYAKPSS